MTAGSDPRLTRLRIGPPTVGGSSFTPTRDTIACHFRPRVDEALRRRHRGRRPQLRGAAGHDHWLPGPERLRQDDHVADASRSGPSDQRNRPDRRHPVRPARSAGVHRRCRAGGRRLPPGVPPATISESWPTPTAFRPAGWTRCWSRSNSPMPPAAASAVSPSACGNGSCLPARCWAIRHPDPRRTDQRT